MYLLLSLGDCLRIKQDLHGHRAVGAQILAFDHLTKAAMAEYLQYIVLWKGTAKNVTFCDWGGGQKRENI